MSISKRSEKNSVFIAPRRLLRAEQIADLLSIGESTWFLWAREGIVEQGQKLGARITVWDSMYVDELMDRILEGKFRAPEQSQGSDEEGGVENF